MTEKDINARISEQVAIYKEAYNRSRIAEDKDKEPYLQQMKWCVLCINRLITEKRKLQENLIK